MNPAALAPACEPGWPDLSQLQTRWARPEVFTSPERRSPGPQGASGGPWSFAVSTSALGIGHPVPSGSPGSPIPSPLGSPARRVERTDVSVLSRSLCSPRFTTLVCKRCSLAPTGVFTCFPRSLPSVPTNQRRGPHSDNDSARAQQLHLCTSRAIGREF